MKKLFCVILLVLLAIVSLGIAAEPSNFTFGVTFGPHPVGFRVVHQYDYSRVYKPVVDLEGKPVTGERARPIQTLVWYPAQVNTSAQPMLYGRYIELLATEENFDGDSAQKAAALQAALEVRGLKDKYDIERVQPTHSFWEAGPVSAKFPVIIYAPSCSASSFENSDLCEYLASNGYIVVSSPNMGPRSRFMTQDVLGIQAQVADIEFLIGYLRNIPQADMSQIAVVGFSWGGISNVFAFMQDDRITALVCLDGSIRYGNEFLKEAKHVIPRRLTVPLFYLASRELTLEELTQFKFDLSTSFLNEAKYSDFHFVLFNGMEHQDFSSLFIRFRPDKQFTDYNATEISESHNWMARYVLQFLNAYIKNDEPAREFLKNSPEKNGVPRHQLAVQSRSALHPAPTISDYGRELAKQGFDKAITIWREAKAKDPGFQLPEKEVNTWGYQLMQEKKLNEAISVFKLNVAMYPEGFNTYDSLAEAQAAAGDKQSAIANYRKSLELNHENTSAVEKLKKLEADQVKK
jgi:dienelactone hydrolase